MINEPLDKWRRHVDIYLRRTELGRALLENIEDAEPFVLIFTGKVRKGKTSAAIVVSDWCNNTINHFNMDLWEYTSYEPLKLFDKVYATNKQGEFVNAYKTYLPDEAPITMNPRGHHVEEDVSNYSALFSARGKTYTNFICTGVSQSMLPALLDQADYINRCVGRGQYDFKRVNTPRENKRKPQVSDTGITIGLPPLCVELWERFDKPETVGKIKLMKARIEAQKKREKRRERRLAKLR